LSTVGSKTSNGGTEAGPDTGTHEYPPVNVPRWVRYLDLVALVLALPLFIVADFPMAGYLVGAGAWLVQRAVQLFVLRKVAATRDPRTIVGLTAGSMIARGWFCAIAIFLVGILDSNEAGLAAALLVVGLFTIYFVVGIILRPFDRPLKVKAAR
jgi:hypothetical protein